jgi:hypothetical protein
MDREQKLILSMAAKIFASRTTDAEKAVGMARDIIATIRTKAVMQTKDALEADRLIKEEVFEAAATIFSSPIKSTSSTAQDINGAADGAINLFNAVSGTKK